MNDMNSKTHTNTQEENIFKKTALVFLYVWVGDGVGSFQPVHCNVHIHDYSYYSTLTAKFLMETNRVIKARSTLCQYYHATSIWGMGI
jgi:hypothetical protein